MTYEEVFGEKPTGKPEIHLAKNEGVTSKGDWIVPAQERIGATVVRSGKLLFFRNNSMNDIDFAGKPDAQGYALASNVGIGGKGNEWLFVRGTNTIDTTGYGVK